MNARAVTLVNRASGLMAQVPGTNQLLCDEGRTWTYLTLRVAEDHLVHTMALLYELGPVQERRAARAASEGGGFRESQDGEESSQGYRLHRFLARDSAAPVTPGNGDGTHVDAYATTCATRLRDVHGSP